MAADIGLVQSGAGASVDRKDATTLKAYFSVVSTSWYIE